MDPSRQPQQSGSNIPNMPPEHTDTCYVIVNPIQSAHAHEASDVTYLVQPAGGTPVVQPDRSETTSGPPPIWTLSFAPQSTLQEFGTFHPYHPYHDTSPSPHDGTNPLSERDKRCSFAAAVASLICGAWLCSMIAICYSRRAKWQTNAHDHAAARWSLKVSLNCTAVALFIGLLTWAIAIWYLQLRTGA